MKKRLLMGLTGVLLAATLVGGATFAEFTSVGQSTGNTFTAGTLVMKMDGEQNVSNTWVSPTNWAPGQEVSKEIVFTNTGTVDANHIYFGFTGVTNNDANGDKSNLNEAIIVKEIFEDFGTGYGANAAADIDLQIGNKDGVLTLKEFSDFYQNGYGYYTWATNGAILKANAVNSYKLKLTFQFNPEAGNEYQGDSAGFTFMARANQNSPTDGLVALHK